MRHCFSAVAALALIAVAQAANAQVNYDAAAHTGVVGADDTIARDEINRLTARLAALEATIAQPESVAQPSEAVYQNPPTETYQSSYVPMMASRPRVDGWTAGFSAYVLKGHWSNTGGTAFHTATTSPVGAGSNTTNTDFSYDYQMTPAVWLGYVHQSGNGFRVGLFQYNQNSTVSAVAANNQLLFDAFSPGGGNFGFGTVNTGERLTVASALQIVAWDIEGTKRIVANDWILTGSAGLRYMYFNQAYSSQLFDDLGTRVGILNERHFVNGAGPTVSINGRRAVGTRGIGFYGTARGSVVFGNNVSSVSQFSLLGAAPALDTINLKSWGTIPVTEFEAGFDFRRNVGRMRFVFDNGLVGQSYFGVGSPSGTHAADGTTSDAILGLYGLRSSVGVYY